MWLVEAKAVKIASVGTEAFLAACEGGHCRLAMWMLDELSANIVISDDKTASALVAACRMAHGS
jgi:hypothetical protein